MAEVVLVPIGRIPLTVNNTDLAGCEDVNVSYNKQTTPHAGPGFADHTVGREFTTVTLVFAIFAQAQEFDNAIASVPMVNGAKRFDLAYKEGTTSYLIKRCVNNAGSVQANEVAGNGSLTRSLVGTERITLGSA